MRKWNVQYNDFLVYFSLFSSIFPRLKLFRRCSKIFRDLERSSKLQDFFEDLCKIFQRYCNNIYLFIQINKLKSIENLFKIFTKIFENLGSLKIKGLQRSSLKLFKDFEEIKTIFFSHMIKDGKYLSQEIYIGFICDRD